MLNSTTLQQISSSVFRELHLQDMFSCCWRYSIDISGQNNKYTIYNNHREILNSLKQRNISCVCMAWLKQYPCECRPTLVRIWIHMPLRLKPGEPSVIVSHCEITPTRLEKEETLRLQRSNSLQAKFKRLVIDQPSIDETENIKRQPVYCPYTMLSKNTPMRDMEASLPTATVTYIT